MAATRLQHRFLLQSLKNLLLALEASRSGVPLKPCLSIEPAKRESCLTVAPLNCLSSAPAASCLTHPEFGFSL